MRRWLRRHIDLSERDRERRRQGNPYLLDSPDYRASGSSLTLGIIKEFDEYHKWYISACRELRVSYRLIDVSDQDWIARVRDSGCRAFLVWPSVSRRAWREMFDERLWFMEHRLGLQVYPTYRETWLYENKRRVHDWLVWRQVPHPQTWVFFQREPAEDFAGGCPLPVVVKTNLGASHSGVWIVRRRGELRRCVRRAFGTGLLARGRHKSESESGFILLQAFLPDVREWRMVRIGDSYFGHPKGRVGEFHSGSGKVEWNPPEARHLDLLKRVTDLGGFTSMAVDMFETTDGRLMVNELQTVFGAGFSVDQTRVNGRAGRYAFHEGEEPWRFEEGDYARNACANARVKFLLERLEQAEKRALIQRT
ncbi:MAG: hypothetical protein H6827_00115 [Planctomycetes bacterium]|nr:hypothetical protein [Planctomycetota bacterium]